MEKTIFNATNRTYEGKDVNVFMYSTVHAIKAHNGSTGTAPILRNLGNRFR